MKMTVVHFEALRSACADVKDANPHITPEVYTSNSIGNDPAVRFRWDLFYASRKRTGFTFSEYLDSHIDTAMRRIVGELYRW